MKVEIIKGGDLVITAQTETEAYALMQWMNIAYVPDKDGQKAYYKADYIQIIQERKQ